MTQTELKERIKQGNLDGVFLFCGEEGYLRRHYIGELRKKLVPDEGMAPFVHFVFDGAEVDTDLILDTARTPSMFGDSKLIEWHNADFEGMKEGALKAIETLCEEMQNEMGCTVVITAVKEGLDTGTEKRPSKLFARLSKCFEAVAFYRSTDAALMAWIRRHFAAEGVAFADSVPASLHARVGHDMDIRAAEIDKLVCYAKANGIAQLTESELALVSIRTVESDAFSLTNALLDGKTEDVYRYLGDMKRRRVDPIAVLGQVAKLYSDLFSVAALAEEGLNEKEIAKALGMHEYRAGIYYRSAQRMGAAAAEKKLALCVRIDAELKRGGSSYRGLEQLVATLHMK